MYVWGVNSTVTKHSDYFVWKDTWEHVTHRCDDTIYKKRVHSCVLKYLSWREFSNQKNGPKNLEILSPMRYWFQNFAVDAAKKKTRRARFLMKYWIHSQKFWEIIFFNVHVHICLHIYACARICLYMYIYMYIYIHVYMYIHIYSYLHIFNTYIHLYIYSCIRTFIDIYMCMNIYIYI